MNKQLTAVEWFEKELDKLDIEIPQAIYDEAIEIEKQQIIEAHREGQEFSLYMDMLDSEEYYNEIFKKQ